MNLIDEIELYLYDSCNVFIILASPLNYATASQKEDDQAIWSAFQKNNQIFMSTPWIFHLK